eukprot:4195406-Amphidinium_carterae.1
MESGATQVRPGRARPRARPEGLAGPLLLRETQASLVWPGRSVSRGPSLLREAQDSQVRPGGLAGLGRSAALPSDDGG